MVHFSFPVVEGVYAFVHGGAQSLHALLPLLVILGSLLLESGVFRVNYGGKAVDRLFLSGFQLTWLRLLRYLLRLQTGIFVVGCV